MTERELRNRPVNFTLGTEGDLGKKTIGAYKACLVTVEALEKQYYESFDFETGLSPLTAIGEVEGVLNGGNPRIVYLAKLTYNLTTATYDFLIIQEGNTVEDFHEHFNPFLIPVLEGFSLNVKDKGGKIAPVSGNTAKVEGTQKVSFDEVKFGLTNEVNLKEGSLKVVVSDSEDVVVNEVTVPSPSAITKVEVDVTQGTKYSYKLIGEDVRDGKIESNDFIIDCTIPPPPPTLKSFLLKVKRADGVEVAPVGSKVTVEGTQKVSFDTATFTIGNKSSAKANSIELYDITKKVTIASGLSLTSPLALTKVDYDITEGTKAEFKLIVQDLKGVKINSNVFTIECTVPEPEPEPEPEV